MQSRKVVYEDFRISTRLKLSALWTTVMFLYIYGDYFELYVPGKVTGLRDGQNMLNTPYKLLLATIVLTIPALMISCTLWLKPKWNRILNISIGTSLTLFTLLVGISSFSEWRIFYVMLSFLESITTILIAWKAWHWPAYTDESS